MWHFFLLKKGGRLKGTLQQSKSQSGKPAFRSQQGPLPFPLQKSNFDILPGKGSGRGEGTNFAWHAWDPGCSVACMQSLDEEGKLCPQLPCFARHRTKMWSIKMKLDFCVLFSWETWMRCHWIPQKLTRRRHIPVQGSLLGKIFQEFFLPTVAIPQDMRFRNLCLSYKSQSWHFWVASSSSSILPEILRKKKAFARPRESAHFC